MRKRFFSIGIKNFCHRADFQSFACFDFLGIDKMSVSTSIQLITCPLHGEVADA